MNQATDKKADYQRLPALLPSPEPTTKITSPSVDSASDDTANTANINNNIAPGTPDYTSSSSEQQHSCPASQERTRGGASGTLEVDTHSRHYSPSPYRTPTWSPESTFSSSHQADVALTQELLGPKIEDSELTPTSTATATEDSLLSPLSLLSAVASVVGNHIGNPGVGNLDDLVTCESLRSLSSTTPALKTLLSSSTAKTISQDSALAYVSHEQENPPSQKPILLQNSPSLLPPAIMGASSASSSIANFAQPIVSLAIVPRKRGRPPKLSNSTPTPSPDGGRIPKLSTIAPKPSQDRGVQLTPRQRSDTPCSTSSSSSLRYTTSEIRPLLPIDDPQIRNGQRQAGALYNVKPTPTPVPRLKHNRKPNPDGAIWSVAELAAETSAERRPARAIVYADEFLKKMVEENNICIMEPCFRNPVKGDLYCVGRPDSSDGRHEHGDICIHEKRGCHIVLAFRYRYQLRLDVTYLAWVTSIDMAIIPVSVLRDFSANRDVMRQALEGEERMAEQYRLLSDAGYFTPRKENKRGQDNNPSVTLDGWSIAHQNEVLMASKSNRLGFLQWVAQAYQMAKGESHGHVVAKREPADVVTKQEESGQAANKRMKPSS
ncbi:hypothetical protein BG015_008253 [Linnemannia schmuckeri]|uniref:Uncharacterized protein n=1 Tax=Linnemannia schmuckeri TaxID=64567 RepID=A0A9P5S0P9_9FUNG|nr:hypothetical protein BG015_008253 [Linnemannia schmuckeri]